MAWSKHLKLSTTSATRAGTKSLHCFESNKTLHSEMLIMPNTRIFCPSSSEKEQHMLEGIWIIIHKRRATSTSIQAIACRRRKLRCSRDAIMHDFDTISWMYYM